MPPKAKGVMVTRVVLITGASSGIGEALAREYAARGYALSLLARRQDRLDSLRADLLQAGGREVLALGCDVAREGDVERAVERSLAELGKLDVVIANAGISVTGRAETMPEADLRRVMETNFFGVVRTAKASMPALLETKGCFAAVGSVSGFIALPGLSAYSASKYALRGFLETLRAEMYPAGVGVTHIAPGFVESELRHLDNEGRLREGAKDPAPAWLVMPARVAARQMANAIEARKREAVITGHGKAAVFLARHCAGLVALGARRAGRKMYDRMAKK